MNHTKTYIAALIITATILMTASTALAQEWRVLLGQGLFQENQISEAMDNRSVTNNDWLGTQTPLLRNTPITSVDQSPRPVDGFIFESEYSQAGSWAPLHDPVRDEGFTLFSF